MKKPACRKRPAKAVRKKPPKSTRTDWNWPCEASVNKDALPSAWVHMLYASDDEADLAQNRTFGGGVSSGATSLAKVSKSISLKI